MSRSTRMQRDRIKARMCFKFQTVISDVRSPFECEAKGMPSHWKKWSRWQESLQHVNCTIEIEGNNFSFDLWIDLHVFFLLKASSKQIMSKSRGKELVNGKWDSVKGSNVFKFQLQDTVHTSHSINSQSYNVLSSEKLLQLRL